MLFDVLNCVFDCDAFTEDWVECFLFGLIGGGDMVYLRRLRWVLVQLAPFGLFVFVVFDLKGVWVLFEHVRWLVQWVVDVFEVVCTVFVSDVSPEEVLWVVWSTSGLAARWEVASCVGGAVGLVVDCDFDAVVQLFEVVVWFTDRLFGFGAVVFVEYVVV